MPGPAVPAKTAALIERVEHGDRGAALTLAELYRPDDIEDFVEFVCPHKHISAWLFDVLADAHAAWQTIPPDG